MLKILTLIFAVVFLTSPDFSRAEIGAQDQVPAATLLFPFFEVDLEGCDSGLGKDTSIVIRNLSAAPAIAHLVAWTDFSVPVFNFSISLTGYDVENFRLADVLCDGNFPDTLGVDGVYGFDRSRLLDYQAAFVGEPSSDTGQCSASARSNRIATGYITVDSVTELNIVGTPADGVSYFSKAGGDNVLVGSAQFRERASVRTVSDQCIACEGRKKKKGKRKCRRRKCGAVSQEVIMQRGGYNAVAIERGTEVDFGAGDDTFYGRYVSGSAVDRREPISGIYSARFGGEHEPEDLNFIFWREGNQLASPVTCGTQPSWFPLPIQQAVVFDDFAEAEELNLSVPHEVQEVEDFISLSPFSSGWVYLNLSHSKSVSVMEKAQAFVLKRENGIISQVGIQPLAP
jgi:hypothetical protein